MRSRSPCWLIYGSVSMATVWWRRGGWHFVMLKESYTLNCGCQLALVGELLSIFCSDFQAASPVTYLHKRDNQVQLVHKWNIFFQKEHLRQEIWLVSEHSLPECVLRYLTHHPSAVKQPLDGVAELLASWAMNSSSLLLNDLIEDYQRFWVNLFLLHVVSKVCFRLVVITTDSCCCGAFMECGDNEYPVRSNRLK